MRVSEQLAQVGIVLKDTTHPGNIGSAARAMRAMGLSRLQLVAAQTRIDDSSRALAAGADGILENAQYEDTLPAALAGYTRVYAFSARRRDMSPRCLTPRAAAAEAMQHIQAGGQAAFVFGGERSGLENEDILQATAIVEIPADPTYTSLNLSQAVQIACYELRLATGTKPATPARDTPTQAAFNAMIDHMKEGLAAIGLPKENDTRPLVSRLRLLLTRANLDDSEVRLLRGVWRAMVAVKRQPAESGNATAEDGVDSNANER